MTCHCFMPKTRVIETQCQTQSSLHCLQLAPASLLCANSPLSIDQPADIAQGPSSNRRALRRVMRCGERLFVAFILCSHASFLCLKSSHAIPTRALLQPSSSRRSIGKEPAREVVGLQIEGKPTISRVSYTSNMSPSSAQRLVGSLRANVIRSRARPARWSSSGPEGTYS